MSLYLGPPPVLTSYGFLDVLATLYCPLLVDPNWTTNQSAVFLLVTQPTTRDTVALNHTLVVSLSAGMSNSMSCTFLSKLLQFQSQLILDYFSYKLYPSLLKIMLYPGHQSICPPMKFLLQNLYHTNLQSLSLQSQVPCSQSCPLPQPSRQLPLYHHVFILWLHVLKQATLNQNHSSQLDIQYLYVFLLILQHNLQSLFPIVKLFDLLIGRRLCKMKWMPCIPITRGPSYPRHQI